MMGFLQANYGMTIVGETPDGTCPMCALAHDPEMPHNRYGLFYQYKFYDRYGRWPTWTDAMAHCTPEVKAAWRHELKAFGEESGEERGR